ncbi:unnamed protein product [Angiostrongylus costaricensis]|uniref:CCDC50_N domain-containing protein n=1 Tax=Angiostrongylus costaricensis TaxID=334426 RepID=A0A158PH67_ANGCS|nr:unnamed protein product [Angiostrongylus costaricensis]
MDENRSFAEIRQRLREIEDQSIASRLQEEEFNKYYNHNRQYRRVVGEDTKHCIKEQANEDKSAKRERVEMIRKIEKSDKEIARRLQQKFEEEEKERHEQQVRIDAELARALADDEARNTDFARAQVLSDTLHVNANDNPRERISSQANFSWENGRTSILHSTQRERSNNDELRPPYQNACASSSSQRPPTYSASASDTQCAALASLHPTNPFLEDVIARDPIRPALELTQITQ